MFIKILYLMKGGGAIIPTSSWCWDKQQKYCQKKKERKERTALTPDEDFEGDFLEVQKNNHGITNGASVVLYWFDPKSGMKMTFENGSKCIINGCICNNCVYNKLFQKSFNYFWLIIFWWGSWNITGLFYEPVKYYRARNYSFTSLPQMPVNCHLLRRWK
jgi:hypothetical protein